jgi:hypothetical protein
LILVAFLTTVYVLSNSGRFHIVDEVSLYAVTESLALRGEVDTNAIAWTQWVNSPGEVLGAFGPDGQVFSKKGPAPAFLAVPWYLAVHAFSFLNISVGQLQATLLFNSVVTAWTAALLWLSALRLGYRDRTAMLLGLLFGIATIAWPYAKQFFGEPLSALSLLTCFYGLLSWRSTGRGRWLFVAGVGAGVALATVNAHAVLIAVLVVWWVADWFLRPSPRRPAGTGDGDFEEMDASRPPTMLTLLRALAVFAAPILLIGVLLAAYNLIRFGSPFDTGYHFDSGEGFTTPIWQGLWGLLFSPYRSVFLHTPLFIASAAASVPFWRRHRSEAIAIGAMSLTLLLLYSTWWMWWGGYAWGPRFLVPLTPFWVLLLAPVVEKLETGTWRRSRRPTGSPGTQGLRIADPQPQAQPSTAGIALFWSTAVLAAISFVVQAAAVFMNFVNYETLLRSLYPTDWSNPLAFGPPAQGLGAFFDSPVFGQFRLMADNLFANTDVAWLWADGRILWLVILPGVAAVLTLACLMLIWWVLWEDDGRGWRMSTPMVILVVALPIVTIGAWVGEVSRDPLYGTPEEGYRAIVADMCKDANSSDAFVNVVPTGYQIPMNWMAGDCLFALPTFGYATDSGQHPETLMVMDRLMQQHDRLFFVTYGVQPNDPDNTLERWLAASAFKAEDKWYGDYRLLQYGTSLRLSGVEERQINQALLGKQAEQVTIVAARAPSIAPAGEPIPIEISFRLEAPTTQNLRWFVQLLSAQNIPLAQLDTGPDDNYATFSTLPARETLVEHAGLLVPANTPEGEYRLIAGLYNPDAEGARLVTVGGPDFVELGAVRVVRGE